MKYEPRIDNSFCRAKCTPAEIIEKDVLLSRVSLRAYFNTVIT